MQARVPPSPAPSAGGRPTTRSFPEVVIAPAPQLAAEFARRVVRLARESVRARGRFSLAIPGGSIARAFLPTLGAAPVPWESTSLFWVDERAAPADDPASNARLARTLLAATPAATVMRHYPIEAHPDPETGARAYAEQLVRLLGTPPILDVVLLGVGEDGHVASLFPGRTYPAGSWVATVNGAGQPAYPRVTLTYETLAIARVVCVAAVGLNKAAIVRTVLGEPTSALPVTRVVAAAREPWVFADDDAASLVHRTP